MHICVAAKSPPFREFLFQILGPYLKYFLFYGHLKKSLCWIMTNLETIQFLTFGVCNVTTSIKLFFKTIYLSCNTLKLTKGNDL